jgi:hypothetical protein
MSPHALLEISSKQIPGVTPVNVFGINRDVGTAWETVWNGPAAFAYPSSAVQMSLVSSNAADTMTVAISGLDANYNQIADLVTLNGTTPVTTNINFYRINSAAILSGSNVGNISISNGGTVYAYIEAELGATQMCGFTVPVDCSLYLFRINIASGTANGNQYISYRNTTRSSNGRILHVAEGSFNNNIQTFDRQIPFRIDEKTDFRFEAKSSNAANVLSVFVEALCMEN